MIDKSNSIALDPPPRGLSNPDIPSLIEDCGKVQEWDMHAVAVPSNKSSATYLQHRSAEPNVVPSCLSNDDAFFCTSQPSASYCAVLSSPPGNVLNTWKESKETTGDNHIQLLHAPISLTILEALTISLVALPQKSPTCVLFQVLLYFLRPEEGTEGCTALATLTYHTYM